MRRKRGEELHAERAHPRRVGVMGHACGSGDRNGPGWDPILNPWGRGLRLQKETVVGIIHWEPWKAPEEKTSFSKGGAQAPV